MKADTYLWYGDTGSGKTSQLGEIAKWVWKRTGKKTRLISADSGWEPADEGVAEGYIEPWGIQGLTNPFPVLNKLAIGYWPQLTGGRLIMALSPLDNIGLVAIEGLATIGNLLLRDHIRNQRKLKDVSMSEFTLPIEVLEGDKVITLNEKFGQADRSHYQQVQDFILLDLVPKFGALPVPLVIWTAHEAKGDDDVTGIKGSSLGPATVGKATVKKTGMKFGDTLHFSKFVSQLRQKGKLVFDDRGQPMQEILYRAYYEDHPDDELTSLKWPAKLSLPLSRIPALHEKFPGGYIPLRLPGEGGGMTEFFEFKYGTQTKAEVGH